MEKIMITNVVSFILILLTLIGLYIADLMRIVSSRVSMSVEILLNAMGFIFLITAIFLWFFAWSILIKQWRGQPFWLNMLKVAILCFGNVFGAYLIIHIYNKNVENAKKQSNIPLNALIKSEELMQKVLIDSDDVDSLEKVIEEVLKQWPERESVGNNILNAAWRQISYIRNDLDIIGKEPDYKLMMLKKLESIHGALQKQIEDRC